MIKEKVSYYITFGQIHPLRNHFYEIVAYNPSEALQHVEKVFGQKWSQIYTDSSFHRESFPEGCIEKVDLHG